MEGLTGLWAELTAAAQAQPEGSEMRAPTLAAFTRVLNRLLPHGVTPIQRQTLAGSVRNGTVLFGTASWAAPRTDQVEGLLHALEALAPQLLGAERAASWVASFEHECTHRQRESPGPSHDVDRLAPLVANLHPGRRARLADLDLTDPRWRQVSDDVGGEVPVYVPRDVDDRLRSLIDGAERHAFEPGTSWGRVVVVSGPPAAGKTRTVLHHLTHQLDLRAELLVPTDPSLRKVAAAIEAVAAQERSAARRLRIVLIDDLQDRLVRDPTTVDGLRILAATRSVAVVITTHRGALPASGQRLTAQRQAAIDGLGLDPATLDALAAQTVELPARLSPAELDRAEPLRGQVARHLGVEPDEVPLAEFTPLAWRLANIDALNRIWSGLDDDHQVTRVRRALVLEALDRWACTLAPIPVDQLLERVERRCLADQPGRAFIDRADLDAALSWFRRPADPHGYGFDASGSADAVLLNDRVARSWLDAHLPVPTEPTNGQEAMTAGSVHFAAGQAGLAQEWWEVAAAAGHPEADYSLGIAALEAGDRDLALDHWERAAGSGHEAARFLQGVIGLEAQRLPSVEATALLRRAARTSEADAAP